MTAEREIAEFTIPFAAGAFTALYLPIPSNPSPVIFLSLAAVSAIILIHPAHKNLPGAVMTGLILASAVLCGIFTGYSADMLQMGTDESSLIINRATRLGTSMKETILKIPFNNYESNAILCALISGNRQELDVGTTTAFRDSGASHILALSGMHLGIIYGLLRYALSILSNGLAAKIIRSVITISVCGLYTVATGAAPSITRALLFIMLGEMASLSGRYKNTGTIMLSALILQLTISPSSAKNVGFQLSYAAMAGIAYIYPRLKAFWPKKSDKEGIVDRLLRWIWNTASISTSCQLTTGPIAWFYFGTFPLYFLLTNILALPLVSLIIPSGLLIMALEYCGFSPMLLIRCTEALITLMTESLRIIASL